VSWIISIKSFYFGHRFFLRSLLKPVVGEGAVTTSAEYALRVNFLLRYVLYRLWHLILLLLTKHLRLDLILVHQVALLPEHFQNVVIIAAHRRQLVLTVIDRRILSLVGVPDELPQITFAFSVVIEIQKVVVDRLVELACFIHVKVKLPVIVEIRLCCLYPLLRVVLLLLLCMPSSNILLGPLPRLL